MKKQILQKKTQISYYMITYHRIKDYNKIIIPEHNPIYYI